MHHSPSLFFDILTTEDEETRDEKIRRASLDIKSAQASSPPHSTKLPHTIAAAGAAADDGRHSTPAAVRTPLEESLTQQPQDQVSLPAAVGKQLTRTDAAEPGQLVLSPQEVLQELLGDMFIHTSRLTMGGLLGQGGFADVHAAELSDVVMPAFTEPVAVKRLRPDVLKSPDDLREFLTEANLLRKLQHRNIVRLRGVGATDLTDLVSMRESMFVVQEFMAGGDLKAQVMSAMAQPFDPPYTKSQAFTWAMHIAEAMHYLHSVCCPMIIHRDLKLDNVLLSGGHMHERVAKLADFGLHKRVRKMTSSGALVAWNQETTYHGGDFERSFYGGKLYLVKSAMSVASSVTGDDSAHNISLHGGSLHAGSTHGGWQKALTDGVPAAASVNGIPVCVAEEAAAAEGASGPELQQPAGTDSTGPINTTSSVKPPLPHSVTNGVTAANGGAAAGAGVSGVQCSDSAASLPDNKTVTDTDKQQQQHQQKQQLLLEGAVRAKSQGLLGKQEFVTRVLAVPSSSSTLQEGPLRKTDKDVARTFAAVQALEGSVRAGGAFYQQAQLQQQQSVQQQQSMQQQQQQQQPAPVAMPQQQQQQQQQRSSSSSSCSRRFGKFPARQPSELCPALLQQLQSGCASGQHSQKFIEATQKVGSLIYMAPEVLTGHQYNEKIDVFSFAIILYELLSGVVVASRVALQGQHEELLDYARQVANRHREAIPTFWPGPVKDLIAKCWAQDPRQRPTFKQILKELYGMKQAGVDVQMEGLRPHGDYNPLTDCGCSIM